MGSGQYSHEASTQRRTQIYQHQTAQQLFSQKEKMAMLTNTFSQRECRDSDEHPRSLPVVLALDVTGSMGRIPERLLKETLPTMMGHLLEQGVESPQLCVMAIGDHFSDRVPVQMSQFESDDELIDKALQDVFIEGNGGGNGGESYPLAWLVAARKVSADRWEKHMKKGILITVGDETAHKNYDSSVLEQLGIPADKSVDIHEILSEARKYYHVFHFNIVEGSNGHRTKASGFWEEILGKEYVVHVQNEMELAKSIAQKLIVSDLGIKKQSDTSVKAVTAPADEKTEQLSDNKDNDILL